MSDIHEKDVHRYSYSRLDTFKTCPRKHHYIYVERIPEPQNEYAYKGSLFHECVEKILKGQDPEPIYKEWHDAVDNGIIIADRDQLEYTVNMYFSYYFADYNKENTLLVEEEFTFPLDDEDYFVEKVDQAYDIKNYLTVRDIKTTSGPLKYDADKVKTNMQLLTYVNKVEEKLDRKVNAIEIDEVRLAKLDTEVPTVKNGKPSTSLDALSLTTADLYQKELEEQGLIDDPKYKAVLNLLELRGHPLFKRTKVQISNRNILETNLEELQGLYVGAAIDLKYRIKDKSKCWMCPYKTLCEHDEFKVDDQLRQKLIDKL